MMQGMLDQSKPLDAHWFLSSLELQNSSCTAVVQPTHLLVQRYTSEPHSHFSQLPTENLHCHYSFYHCNRTHAVRIGTAAELPLSSSVSLPEARRQLHPSDPATATRTPNIPGVSSHSITMSMAKDGIPHTLPPTMNHKTVTARQEVSALQILEDDCFPTRCQTPSYENYHEDPLLPVLEAPHWSGHFMTPSLVIYTEDISPHPLPDWPTRPPPILIPQEYSVHFGTITVREYDQIIGDNPACSSGPSLAIDWQYREYDPIPVDDFESGRPRRLCAKDLVLSRGHREEILRHLQYTDLEIAHAVRQNQEIRHQRKHTLSAMAIPALGSLDAPSKKHPRCACDEAILVQLPIMHKD